MVDNQRYDGVGAQIINYGRDQNVNHGRDQIIASDVIVVNGDFVKIFNSLARNPHKTLWEAVADVGASHTAEQQYERGECLEGTRVELRRIIHEWGQAGGQGSPLCWLAGAAGVGKTAIAMSVAKALQQEGRLVSSFFFFRSDSKRNNPQALVLTIAHGIISRMPFMRRRIEQRISEDPQILEARLEDQLRELVLDPILNPVCESSWMRRVWTLLLQALCLMLSSVMLLDVVWGFWAAFLSVGPAVVPDIVIIDGLDECSDEDTQKRILNIIQSAIRRGPHCPLRFLICSRPEAWIQEAFTAEPLCNLTKVILLDDEFRPVEDITKYFRHHFQEIVNNPKYNHVRFPNPWPSQRDFRTLVDKSCSHFVYVTTVVKFITLADNHPIDQLHLILESSPTGLSGASPFRELDALYHAILKASHHPEKVHDILVVILSVLPGYLEPTPAHIELLLGLPSGQVALTLRGMHSVLQVHGPADAIRIHHTSFRDFLVDQNRSRDFYIDLPAQKHIVAQKWLQQLTTSKIRAYSIDQLYCWETKFFFTEWMAFCTQFPKPTRSLLEHLRNVDLSAVFLFINANIFSFPDVRFIAAVMKPGIRFNSLSWSEVFQGCHSWVQRYHNREIVDDVAGRRTTEGQHQAGSGYDTDAERNIDDLVEGLLVKLVQFPKCAHLECAPGVGLEDETLPWVAPLTSGCQWDTPLISQSIVHRDRLSRLRLTDCHCDLVEVKESNDPSHLTYPEACMGLLKGFVSEFDALSHTSSWTDINLLFGIFLYVVHSSFLGCCHPDMELLSLCGTFFDSVKRSIDILQTKSELLEWLETVFPVNLVEEVETLKQKVHALPWSGWVAQQQQQLADQMRRANNRSAVEDGDTEKIMGPQRLSSSRRR
ncbi:hypothetical protein PQX77_019964 [Marasmius sp. AFHP31]|nr:hypothetical protein PQX77_019964 [Marasmius sp. AFHP31]